MRQVALQAYIRSSRKLPVGAAKQVASAQLNVIGRSLAGSAGIDVPLQSQPVFLIAPVSAESGLAVAPAVRDRAPIGPPGAIGIRRFSIDTIMAALGEHTAVPGCRVLSACAGSSGE